MVGSVQELATPGKRVAAVAVAPGLLSLCVIYGRVSGEAYKPQQSSPAAGLCPATPEHPKKEGAPGQSSVHQPGACCCGGSLVFWASVRSPANKILRSPGLERSLLEGLRLGLTQGEACTLVGIGRLTLARWMRRHDKFAEEASQALRDGHLLRAQARAKVKTDAAACALQILAEAGLLGVSKG